MDDQNPQITTDQKPADATEVTEAPKAIEETENTQADAIAEDASLQDSKVVGEVEHIEQVESPQESGAKQTHSEASGEPSGTLEDSSEQPQEQKEDAVIEPPSNPNAKWYVVHTFAGHENKVATALKQRIEAERLDNLIFDILVPTQDKIEIRGGKKETVKEKIFPGYILIKMELNDISWLAVRTTQGVTSFIGAGNKPTPISEAEVATIVKFTTQGAQPTFKDVFMVDDTVKIVDGPFAEFIGKVDSVDKEKGRVRVLVSIFGRETPVELDFLQVQKL